MKQKIDAYLTDPWFMGGVAHGAQQAFLVGIFVFGALCILNVAGQHSGWFLMEFPCLVGIYFCDWQEGIMRKRQREDTQRTKDESQFAHPAPSKDALNALLFVACPVCKLCAESLTMQYCVDQIRGAEGWRVWFRCADCGRFVMVDVEGQRKEVTA